MTRRRGMSLAGQYLRLQLLIVLAVLVAVVAISLAQSAAAFERVEGRRALSAAETLAANPAVRSLLPNAQPQGSSVLELRRCSAGSLTNMMPPSKNCRA